MEPLRRDQLRVRAPYTVARAHLGPSPISNARYTSQYHLCPASPRVSLFGFKEIILCPGIRSPLKCASKTPEIARRPMALKESYLASPLQDAHSGDHGDDPSPRSLHRVTTSACLKMLTGSFRSSAILSSMRYSVGHSGHRLIGRHSGHKVMIGFGRCRRYLTSSPTLLSPLPSMGLGIWRKAHLTDGISSPSLQCAHTEKYGTKSSRE